MAQVQLSAVVGKLRSLAGADPGPTDEQLLDAFARRRDESAFTSLVRRHSALVMGVCRRTLGHRQDAEDAFQATFLVLARCAGSVRRAGSLSAWLYGVSHRIAMNAKRSLARRRGKETRGARPESAPPEDPSWREVQALLDEEVQRLPEIYRRVFVLCCLDEQTKADAARQLGLREGTVSSRLAKARTLLRERLRKRGVTLSALLAALEVAREGAPVGAATVKAAAAAAVQYAAGACAGGAVPAQAAALANGVTPAVLFTKAKVLPVLLLLGGLLAAGAGVLFAPLGAAPSGERAKSTPPGKKEGPAKPAEVRGRVVGPDGRPVKGARIYVTLQRGMDAPPGPAPKVLAESDAGGKFRVPGAALGDPSTVWVAVAEGFGLAVADGKAVRAGGEITLRLAKDDVPVVGQIVNLEGKPVGGVTVRPFMVGLTEKEDLGLWLRAVRDKKRMRVNDFFPTSVASPAGVPGLPARLTTDEAGRFRLRGVGRERIVVLDVSGPKVENDLFVVMTRAGKPFRVKDAPDSELELKVYPATFRHAVSPPRPLVGTVRDNKTGKPIPGVAIDVGMGPLLRPTTGKDGTYQLDSLPGLLFRAGEPQSIHLIAVPPADRPYLPGFKVVRRPRGAEPLRADFSLPLGVWAEGRVTDKRTRKPVQATVEYLADTRNPGLKDYPDYPTPERPFQGLFHTRPDGKFRIPVLPGKGAVIVRVSSGDYLPAESLSEDQAGRLGLPPPRTLLNFNAVALIDAKAGATPVKCDLTVDPGQTLTCKLLDPDGKPVKGARVKGYRPLHFWSQRPLEGAKFTLTAMHPKHPRWLVVLHPGRQLGASVEVKVGDREPVPVRLKPTGTITGRVLDPDGDPWKRQELRVFYHKPGGAVYQHLPEVLATDDEGRFRVRGVIPGLMYQVVVSGKPPRTTVGTVATRLTVKPGETRDLGDVKARLFRE
jgi:RNA polymerase sigma factor (sigma-70 family)